MTDILMIDPAKEELKQSPIGQWVNVLYSDFGYLHICGKECIISLEPQPGYCNRGRWLARLEAWGITEIDWADGWHPGRYYFDVDRAKLEIEAWLQVRRQLREGIGVASLEESSPHE